MHKYQFLKADIKPWLKYSFAKKYGIPTKYVDATLNTNTTNTLTTVLGKIKNFKLHANLEQASSILPDGYTQVDYIEGHYAEYIELSSNIQCDYFELDCVFTEIERESAIIGNYNGGGINRWELYSMNKNTYYSIWNYSGNNVISDVSAFTRANITYDYSTYDFYINGEQKMNKSLIIAPKYLFAYGNGNILSAGRIYKYSSKKNNILTAKLIPCYRNSDNEVGMYDIINDVFYTNQGTGAFTYGSVVTVPNPDFPIDIHTITGNNTIKIDSKTLVNLTYARIGYTIDASTGLDKVHDNNACCENYISVKPNTRYVLKTDINCTNLRLSEYTNNKIHIIRKQIGNANSLTITTGETTYYVRWSLNINNTIMTEEKLLNANLTLVEEQSLSLNLGDLEYCAMDNYEDEFYLATESDTNLVAGKWYLKKNIIKTNNCENLINTVGTGNDGNRYFLISKSNLNIPTGNQQTNIIICNKFNEQTVSADRIPGQFQTNTNNTAAQFIIDSSYHTIADVKAAITDITVYGKASAPEYILLNDTLQSQLNAIENTMRSYKEQTNITVETNINTTFDLSYKTLDS